MESSYNDAKITKTLHNVYVHFKKKSIPSPQKVIGRLRGRGGGGETSQKTRALKKTIYRTELEFFRGVWNPDQNPFEGRVNFYGYFPEEHNIFIPV